MTCIQCGKTYHFDPAQVKDRIWLEILKAGFCSITCRDGHSEEAFGAEAEEVIGE